MKINHIKISNILGIEELEFDAGAFTVIEGTNGCGKTSVLEAIKAALRPGHDATLLRNGAAAGEIVFVLEDGSSIQRRVSGATTSTDVRGADGKKVARPAEAIARLADMLSVNPVEFLTARKQDRVKVLLEAMPLELDVDKLSKLAGVPVKAAPGLHALHVIDTVRQRVYEDRTSTNRAVKEKEGTINQIQLAMPDSVGGVMGDDEDGLETAIAVERDKLATTMRKIDAKMTGIREAAAKRIAEIDEKLQGDIEALRAAATMEKDAIKLDTGTNAAKAETARTNAATSCNAAQEPLKIALANIKQNRMAAAKREQALDTIAAMQTELTDLQADADKQTATLAAIDAYKTELLENLPIPDIEVREGEIYKDGVPLDRLNTAAQVGIAVEVAKLRAGTLGAVCVDRIESLDAATFAEFKRAMAKTSLQLFVSRVTDGEFSVTTDD